MSQNIKTTEKLSEISNGRASSKLNDTDLFLISRKDNGASAYTTNVTTYKTLFDKIHDDIKATGIWNTDTYKPLFNDENKIFEIKTRAYLTKSGNDVERYVEYEFLKKLNDNNLLNCYGTIDSVINPKVTAGIVNSSSTEAMLIKISYVPCYGSLTGVSEPVRDDDELVISTEFIGKKSDGDFAHFDQRLSPEGVRKDGYRLRLPEYSDWATMSEYAFTWTTYERKGTLYNVPTAADGTTIDVVPIVQNGRETLAARFIYIPPLKTAIFHDYQSPGTLQLDDVYLRRNGFRQGATPEITEPIDYTIKYNLADGTTRDIVKVRWPTALSHKMRSVKVGRISTDWVKVLCEFGST